MRFPSVSNCFALFLGLVLAAMVTSTLQAVPLKDTSTAGSWNTGTNWTPNGVPVAGQSVNVDLNMSVATSASFGDSTEASIWTGVTSNDSIVVAAGQTLTHVAGSTLNIPNTVTDIRLGGAGTFLNNGLMRFTGSNVFYIGVSGLSKLNNGGTFEFNGATNQRIDLYGNGSRFNNIAGGTVLVNMPASTSVARIMGSVSTSDGQFVQTGNPITFNQGVLVLAPPNGIGGTLNDAMLTSLIGAGANPINANSELRLAGGMNDIILTGGSNLDRVKLGSGTDAFYVRSGGTTINVSGTGIKTAGNGLVTFEAGTGRTLTNQGHLIFDVTTGDVRLNGLGSYDNASTGYIEHKAGIVYMSVSGSTTFNNSGTYEFNTPNTRFDMYLGSPRFNNLPGGVINVNMSSATGTARIMGSIAATDGEFIQTGTNGINFTQGVLVLAPPGGFGGTIDDTLFTKLVGAGPNPINANSELRLAGGLNDIVLTGGSKLDRVRLGSGTDAINVRAGGSIINVSGTGIRTANHSGGLVTINTAVGRNLTNQGVLVLDSPLGDIRVNGTGSLNNAGTVTQTNTLMYINVNAGQTAAFNNSGTHTFNTANATIDLYQGGAAYNNLAAGTMRTAMSSAAGSLTIRHSVGGTVDFTNLGTVETTGGIFRVNSNVNMPQLTSSALTGGTWKVLANTVDATLDLLASGTGVGTAAPYDGTINTIGSGAALVLSKQGVGNALFPQLGVLQTVGGDLYVHGAVNLPVAAAMNVTGTLGGDGIVTSPGTITLNGGELDPSSLSGGAGTLTINGNLTLGNTTQLSFSLNNPGIIGGGINDLVTVNGNLTLDGVLDITELPNFSSGSYRLFNYSGTLFDNGLTLTSPYYILDVSTINQVNLLVLPVPEPSTGWLLLVGLAALRRRKRG